MGNSSVAKVYDFSSKMKNKQLPKPILKKKPIRFSDMSEKDQRESIDSMRED